MTAAISLYGRLGQDPRTVATKTGTPMATASLAVSLSDDDSATWFGVVAFSRQADELTRHSKGDLVSVSGRLQVNRWTTQTGEAREQLQVVADTVLSARTVRPRGGRKASAHDLADRFHQPHERK